jgi:hypothetical protein
MELVDVKLKVPVGMENYIEVDDKDMELERNALWLYPLIKNATISHGRAAEILGINKLDLIQLYGELGLSYLDMDISEVDEELETYKKLKR